MTRSRHLEDFNMFMNKKCWSRREFLKTAGAAGMATLLTGAELQNNVSAAMNSNTGPLPMRPFGKTGAGR